MNDTTEFVNRTTWRILRKQSGAPGVGTFSPTLKEIPIATYVASQVRESASVFESVGAPVVAIDAVIPDLPSYADIREGDIALDMERNVRFSVVSVSKYPGKMSVSLKAAAQKSSQ